MKRNIILSIFIFTLFIFSSSQAYDDSATQLMAMLQMKMEEVAQLKAENESLKKDLETCQAMLPSTESNIIVKQPVNNSCTNQAEFIDDITIPDGSKVAPGEGFTKIWRLRNTGTCTWTNYKVVSIGRFHMGGERSAYLPKTVKPGETVDVAMKLVAPTYIGDYASEYRLQDDSGNLFGITGTLSKKELSFWLKINVVDKSKCGLVSMTPSTVWRNGEFDLSVTIRNNSGETWNAKGVDVRMTEGKDYLKFDKAYIDLPSSVDPGNTITLIYDMIASEEGGNHGITLEFIRDGGVYCSVNGVVTFK